MHKFWVWLSGTNEDYNNQMFFKEFAYIALIYVFLGIILLASFWFKYQSLS